MRTRAILLMLSAATSLLPGTHASAAPKAKVGAGTVTQQAAFVHWSRQIGDDTFVFHVAYFGRATLTRAAARAPKVVGFAQGAVVRCTFGDRRVRCRTVDRFNKKVDPATMDFHPAMESASMDAGKNHVRWTAKSDPQPGFGYGSYHHNFGPGVDLIASGYAIAGAGRKANVEGRLFGRDLASVKKARGFLTTSTYSRVSARACALGFRCP